ncbi:hypothetical protein BA022_04630 [Diaphorobacter nitroreducens]|nr:hypothetical protein BA022_04630 [Diaphorobacter nitroreducens]
MWIDQTLFSRGTCLTVFKKSLHIAHGPRITAAPLDLYDQTISIDSDCAGESAWLMRLKFRL